VRSEIVGNYRYLELFESVLNAMTNYLDSLRLYGLLDFELKVSLIQ